MARCPVGIFHGAVVTSDLATRAGRNRKWRASAKTHKLSRNSGSERFRRGQLSPAVCPLRRHVAQSGWGEDRVREPGRRWATWQRSSDDVGKEQHRHCEVLHELLDKNVLERTLSDVRS